MNLLEKYTEGKDSTFTHEGGSYTVDELIQYAKNKQVIEVELKELQWMYDNPRLNKRRIAKVIIDGYPIIVTHTKDGKLVTLDGFHRAYKAIQEGREYIEAIYISRNELEKLKH